MIVAIRRHESKATTKFHILFILLFLCISNVFVILVTFSIIVFYEFDHEGAPHGGISKLSQRRMNFSSLPCVNDSG